MPPMTRWSHSRFGNPEIKKMILRLFSHVVDIWVEICMFCGPLLTWQHQEPARPEFPHFPQGSVLAPVCITGQLIEVLRRLWPMALNMLEPANFASCRRHALLGRYVVEC